MNFSLGEAKLGPMSDKYQTVWNWALFLAKIAHLPNKSVDN